MFGEVLKKWFESGKVKREELFIVTKVHIKYYMLDMDTAITCLILYFVCIDVLLMSGKEN